VVDSAEAGRPGGFEVWFGVEVQGGELREEGTVGVSVAGTLA
jgi:hypothetical protein